jgi:hypothetical protein
MGRRPRVDRTPEEKWQIVQEGVKSGNVSETCRRHGISTSLLPHVRRAPPGQSFRSRISLAKQRLVASGEWLFRAGSIARRRFDRPPLAAAKCAHHVDPILTLNVVVFSRFAGIISVHRSCLWRSCTQSPPFADAKDGAPGDLVCCPVSSFAARHAISGIPATDWQRRVSPIIFGAQH